MAMNPSLQKIGRDGNVSKFVENRKGWQCIQVCRKEEGIAISPTLYLKERKGWQYLRPDQ